MLEERIVRFCAPTLAGLKTGNLFNTGKAPLACVKKELVLLLPELEKHGLSARLFLPAKKRALLYVYRVSALSRDLREPNTALFLQELGYDTQSPDAALNHLADRLHTSQGFPHEIGLFLSYPLHDVTSFIALGGSACTLCGHWCVYSEEDTARHIFQRYDQCTACYRSYYQEGLRLAQLACAS